DEYRAAFQSYGLPAHELSVEEAARRIQGSPIQAQLLAALDDWASPDDPRRKELFRHLLLVARHVESNPWRRGYFDARIRRDYATLRRLARQPEALAQPPAVLCTLAGVLGQIDRGAAQELLRAAQRRYPADLRINFAL